MDLWPGSIWILNESNSGIITLETRRRLLSSLVSTCNGKYHWLYVVQGFLKVWGKAGGGVNHVTKSQNPKESQMCSWCSACLAINRDLPFIPNLERRPYLLIRTKRTRRRMQAKPAKPTAMETWEKTSVESESGCSHVIIPSGLPFTFKYAESEQSGSTKTCLSCHLFQVTDDSLKTFPIGRL